MNNNNDNNNKLNKIPSQTQSIFWLFFQLIPISCFTQRGWWMHMQQHLKLNFVIHFNSSVVLAWGMSRKKTTKQNIKCNLSQSRFSAASGTFVFFEVVWKIDYVESTVRWGIGKWANHKHVVSFIAQALLWCVRVYCITSSLWRYLLLVDKNGTNHIIRMMP